MHFVVRSNPRLRISSLYDLETTLAALYSSEGSVMERHHLAQAMCILNTEGCDILEALPRRDYDRAIMMLRDYILATDLANYFKLVWFNNINLG